MVLIKLFYYSIGRMLLMQCFEQPLLVDNYSHLTVNVGDLVVYLRLQYGFGSS